MLESRKLVPEIYTKSRDYQALLKLFDLIMCSNESGEKNFVSYINPERCPSSYLPMLSSFLGYEYDSKYSYEINRLIITYFRDLIKNRGNEAGIKLAVAIAVNASNDNTNIIDYSSMNSITNLISVGYDPVNGEINVYILFDSYIDKIFDLIEVVRPAGTKINIIKSNQISKADKALMKELMTYNVSLAAESHRYDVAQNTGSVGDPGEVARTSDTGESIAADDMASHRVEFGEVPDHTEEGE